MGGKRHVTFEVGDRSPAAVETAVRTAVRELWADDQFPDTEPTVFTVGEAVVWSNCHGFEQLAVDADRAVLVTVPDSGAGTTGVLYERLGDRFVEIDRTEIPVAGADYIVDYFRINYGIVPWCRSDRPVGPRTRADADTDWEQILSRDERPPIKPAQIGQWIDAWLDADIDRSDRKTVVELLALDSYYHPARQLLARFVGEPPPQVFDRLDEENPAQTVRRIAAAGSVHGWRECMVDLDQYTQFLRAIPDADRRTRALVAPMLWEPMPLHREMALDSSLVTALLSLCDDAVPELRIAGLVGAANVLGAFQKAHNEDRLDAMPTDTVEAFYDAYEAALTDDDVRVRERAVALGAETLATGQGQLFSTWDCLPFERRWAIARSYAATDAAEATATHDDGGFVLSSAFNGETEAIPTLIEYAYDEQGPYYESVRETLATVAADDPKAVLDSVDLVIDVVTAGTETVADLELLAELASVVPDRLLPTSQALETLIESESESETKRRLASRTLLQLPADAVTIDTATLVEAADDVFDSYKLVPERVGALARADPASTSDLLAKLPDQLNDHEKVERRQVDTAVGMAAAVDPSVVQSALPALTSLLDEPAAVGRGLMTALAATAENNAAALAEYTDDIGVLLAHPDAYIREAAATVLVAVGQAEPTALSPPLDSLLAHTDAAFEPGTLPTDPQEFDRTTPVDWPFGVIVAADRKFATAAVLATTVPGRELNGDLPSLLQEAAAGDLVTGGSLLRTLLERERLGIEQLDTPPVAQEQPALLAHIAQLLVERLALRDGEADGDVSRLGLHPSWEAKEIEGLLAVAAEADPESVRDAIDRQYDSVGAFHETYPTDQRKAVIDRIESEHGASNAAKKHEESSLQVDGAPETHSPEGR